MASLTDKSDELIQRIKEQAVLFCADNYRFVTASDLLVIENAMLIGATIKGEVSLEYDNEDLRS